MTKIVVSGDFFARPTSLSEMRLSKPSCSRRPKSRRRSQGGCPPPPRFQCHAVSTNTKHQSQRGRFDVSALSRAGPRWTALDRAGPRWTALASREPKPDTADFLELVKNRYLRRLQCYFIMPCFGIPLAIHNSCGQLPRCLVITMLTFSLRRGISGLPK